MKRKSGGWKRVHLNTTDLLWSNVVRERDGWRCQWPLCARSRAGGAQIEAAHILSRRYKQTKWMTVNGIALCWLHHQWASDHDTEWQAFGKESVGEEIYLRLLILAKGPARRAPDEFAARLALREELARLMRQQVMV